MHQFLIIKITLLVLIFTGIKFRGSGGFDEVRENLYTRKMLSWKSLSFLRNLGYFCSISMANPRKYIPAKYGHFYHSANEYPQKLIPIR